MFGESPHRARFAAVPSVLLVSVGTGLGLGGWLAAGAPAYLWGLALVALGGSLLVFIALPMVRRLYRAGLCLVLAAAVVGVGVWVPRQSLAAEFAGENVRWSIPSVGADGEFVVAVFGDTVALAGPAAARLVSLTDGRELTTLRADRDDRFSVAGDRLLVADGRSATLYDQAGDAVWPDAVPADRGVAAFPGVTVVEREGVVSAIGDDGTVRWTRPGDPIRAESNRFPNVADLPLNNIYLEHGPPVLPRLAALPVAGSETAWEFVDAAGTTVARADGTYAGSVDDVPIVSTVTADRCAVWRDGAQGLVGATFCKPWAVGDVLFFENGADARVVPADGGEHVELESVALMSGRDDRRLAVGATAMAWRDGSLIRGYPGLGYGDPWQFVAESEQARPYVADDTVVVQTALRRTNPFDPREGMAPGREFPDQDYRITVLDAGTGRVTGAVRVHSVGSITPLRAGSALLAADGRIVLIGR